MPYMNNLQQKFINLLPEWFKSIPNFDKILHLIAGLVIYLISIIFISYELSMLPVFIFGSVKEIYDNQQKGNFASLLDLGATMFLPFLILIYHIIQNR